MASYLDIMCEFVAKDHSLADIGVRRVVEAGEPFEHAGFAGDNPNLLRYCRYRISSTTFEYALAHPGQGTMVSAGEWNCARIMLSAGVQTARGQEPPFRDPKLLAFYRADAFTFEEARQTHQHRRENDSEFDGTASFVVLHVPLKPVRSLFAPLFDAPLKHHVAP